MSVITRACLGSGLGSRARPIDRVLPWLVAGTLFAMYAVLSVQRHRQHLTSGFDLGIFEQEVRSYAAGHLPTSTLKGPGFQLLGDHFSPIVATIVPLYRVFPSALTLLVAQAALLALAAVPLVSSAQRNLGRPAALVVAAGYGLSWGIAQTIGFDFHEVAFAVPMLAFSAVALVEDRTRAAVLWAAPLVLVKEDLGLTVAALGLLVAWRGERTLGLLTAAGGALATLLEMQVIIPAFNPAGNAYTGQLAHPMVQLLSILRPDSKIVTVVLLLAPTAFVALRSPLVFLAVPTLLWRFLSDNPSYWTTSNHYSAVLMPIVFAAFLDGLRRRPARRTRVLMVSLLATAYLVAGNPFAQLASSALWQHNPQVTATNRLLEEVPSGKTVSASNWLAPQLTGRDDVSIFGRIPLTRFQPDYILVDTRQEAIFPGTLAHQQALLAQAKRSGYTVIDHATSVILLQRTSRTG